MILCRACMSHSSSDFHVSNKVYTDKKKKTLSSRVSQKKQKLLVYLNEYCTSEESLDVCSASFENYDFNNYWDNRNQRYPSFQNHCTKLSVILLLPLSLYCHFARDQCASSLSVDDSPGTPSQRGKAHHVHICLLAVCSLLASTRNSSIYALVEY